MRFRVATLFPSLISCAAGESILARGIEAGLLEIVAVDLRPYGEGRHHTVDDSPYGGGAGMVMKVAPLVAAIEEARTADPETRVVLLTPQGRRFDQSVAREFSQLPSLTLICGRYEGFDDRVGAFVDEELSIGDFILMGGEVAALAVVEATARLIPGVLGDAESAVEESLEDGLLEYPHFTRPRVFRGLEVPEVLLSGNHAEIARWRRARAIERTAQRRPDLLAEVPAAKNGSKGG